MKLSQKSRLIDLIKNADFPDPSTEELASEYRRLTISVLESRLVDVSQRVGEADNSVPGFWMLDCVDLAGVEPPDRWEYLRGQKGEYTTHRLILNPAHIVIVEPNLADPPDDLALIELHPSSSEVFSEYFVTKKSLETAMQIERDRADARTLPILLAGLGVIT